MAENQPLFFAHYSFLGLDPRNLLDSNGSYWEQNVAHARYNYDYCVRNPQGHAGYSASFPYTPEESLSALHYFYYKIGDRLWGTYGFKDSFSLDRAWFASSYLAIDQGPIVVMIENYRTALLWNLFMKNAHIRAGLDKLGFKYE